MVKKRNKKGALVQTTIISIIIIILSAAIIFFFFNAFPYKSTIDKEACHQSVILRSQSIAGIEPGRHIIPLNCKTEEITISSTNGRFIAREISNAMYDCWWMLGEGKHDFFSDPTWQETIIDVGSFQGTAQANCVICSIIRFEENVKEKQMEIDVLEFMSTTKVPIKNITYLEYLSGQEDATLPTDIEINKINTNQDYIVVFMGVRGGSFGNAVKGLAISSGVGAFTGFMIGSLAGPKGMLWGAGVGATVGQFLGYLNGIKEVQNANIASIRCDEEFSVSDPGCFILYLVPLSAEELSTTCQNIESIP